MKFNEVYVIIAEFMYFEYISVCYVDFIISHSQNEPYHRVALYIARVLHVYAYILLRNLFAASHSDQPHLRRSIIVNFKS